MIVTFFQGRLKVIPYEYQILYRYFKMIAFFHAIQADFQVRKFSEKLKIHIQKFVCCLVLSVHHILNS